MRSERDPSGTRRLSAVRAIRALGGTVRVLPGGMDTGIVHGPELPPVLAWERQRAGAWGWDAVPDTRDVRPEPAYRWVGCDCHAADDGGWHAADCRAARVRRK